MALRLSWRAARYDRALGEGARLKRLIVPDDVWVRQGCKDLHLALQVDRLCLCVAPVSTSLHCVHRQLFDCVQGLSSVLLDLRVPWCSTRSRGANTRVHRVVTTRSRDGCTACLINGAEGALAEEFLHGIILNVLPRRTVGRRIDVLQRHLYLGTQLGRKRAHLERKWHVLIEVGNEVTDIDEAPVHVGREELAKELAVPFCGRAGRKVAYTSGDHNVVDGARNGSLHGGVMSGGGSVAPCWPYVCRLMTPTCREQEAECAEHVRCDQ